ncbi:MAG: hypothetical protein R2713_16775 [Ilumatobacteraceae bacterium]
MPGGRPVDDHQIVLAAAFELLQFAEHHDVVDPRRRRRHHVDDAAGGEPLRDPLHPVRLEILGEGVGCGERQVRQVAHQIGELRLAVEIDREHPQPGVECSARQNCRYRGLPDPALAGHDDQPGGGQELPWIQPLRRHSCAD